MLPIQSVGPQTDFDLEAFAGFYQDDLTAMGLFLSAIRMLDVVQLYVNASNGSNQFDPSHFIVEQLLGLVSTIAGRANSCSAGPLLIFVLHNAQTLSGEDDTAMNCPPVY